MKQLLIIFTVFLFFGISATNAQEKVNISGTITDERGVPVIGVNIFLEGTTKGATSDFDGQYVISKLDSNVNYVLVISSVGFKTIREEIILTNDLQKDIVLKEDLLSLDEIVVTGSSNPKSKLESSVAITTIGYRDIEKIAPQTSADLLQSIPGFVVESSGGEVGNNLFARGIPAAGAYEFVQIQEDGLPVFEDGALQFGNVDNWYRIDENIKRMEAVRGGSASVFATNAPGGIINFISKTGQNELRGRAKMTVGDYGLFRTDLNIGGSIVEDKLFFNIGGFYRVDDGIRDPGFEANKGGQMKLNLTYKFEKGYARIHYKKLNDRNIFLLPIPLRGDSDGNPEEFTGFDANYGTLTSRNFSRLRVPQVGGGFFERDLEDGVNPNVDAIGGEFKYRITEFLTLKNSFRNTDIDLNYNAIFSTGGPNTQADFATQTTQFPLDDAANAEYTYVDNGELLNPNSLVMRADHWAIDKDMSNFANNLTFAFDFEKINITLGYYYSNWKSNQYWNWSNYLVDVSDNPRLVNLIDTNTGISRTYNGIERITWLERDAQTKGKLNALYLDAEVDLTEKLTANFGLRHDNDKYAGYRDNARFFSTDLGLLDNNTADDAITVVDGNPYTYWNYDVKELSYTTALNYKFNDRMAMYARYSHGFRTPIEESYYNNAADLSGLEITEIDQTELGFKYSNSNIGVYANLFYMSMDNIAFADILADGSSENRFADINNLGLEIEANARFGIFSLAATTTIQNPKYNNYTGSNADGTSFDFDGNTARRIPKFYFTLRPQIEIVKNLELYTQWSYFGKKFQNESNTVELPAFNVFNAGLSYKYDNLRFALDGTNLFNEIGLTEGNPRGTTSANDDVFLARPILGRAFRLSVALDF
ncbi:TonB-dependent receptor [Aquimarina sp. 2201CG14-23]|uniref:TonB-dependent receptor n=1 Tax=Aquimarina mycalae TaxID=3040073 RepID=UPI002478207C|nr:TonB-dependent receptor [Aquimarina sp. 2201CG14-23]MDH7445374.1 TonB-dependent receptor [Aquimarina sp. 2201CG14-23]